MAVVDTYVQPFAVASSERVTENCDPLFGTGKKVHALFNQFTVAAADDNGSVYRVFRQVPGDLRFLQAALANEAITGGTQFSLGIYRPGIGGAVIDIDAFCLNQDLSAARASLFPGVALNAGNLVTIGNIGKKLFELAGHTDSNRLSAYDICLTGTTVGTAAGIVALMMLFAAE